MKKRWILLILPLMMMVMPVASANGWGLPEALVPLVSNTNDYDDYYHLADDYARKENSARIIMQSRYHNQLIAAEKGADGWKSVIVSTTAVYQPSEQSTSGKPKLARINNGFELAYPKVKELYRFEYISNDWGEMAYTLMYAKMGSVEIERKESYRYLVTQGTDSAMWSEEVTLENFNLSHVPVYIMSEEQLGMYATYMATLGNRPDLFPGSGYIGKYVEGSYTDYDIPPEALDDEVFAAIIKEAEKYLGYPYVWGGSSPSTSFDCSGFVSWVINHSGWDVGRLGAQGLCNICTPVSSANVKPGDLVFFTGTYDTPGVSHVGIYVGNNMMIHCGDPISYANLNSSYWQSHFYRYGRLP